MQINSIEAIPVRLPLKSVVTLSRGVSRTIEEGKQIILVKLTADDGTVGWRYSVARMSSWKQTVQLDGTEVWSVLNYHQSGRSKTGPYVEAGIGTYTPNDPSEE